MNSYTRLLCLVSSSLLATLALAELPVDVNLKLDIADYPAPPWEVLLQLYDDKEATVPIEVLHLTTFELMEPQQLDTWDSIPTQTIRTMANFNLDATPGVSYWAGYQVDGVQVGELFAVPAANVSFSGLVESRSGGFLFPDGSVQGSAAVDTNPWASNGSDIYYNLGYVGIGTSTPASGLELKSAAGYGSSVALSNTGGGLKWNLTSWIDGTFRLVKTSGTTFSAMVVEPVDGHVGIGTSAPDQKLSVHASTGISYIRVSDGTSGTTSGLRMGMSGSGNAYIINDETAKSLSLGTNGTSQIRILDTGRVGINELTPDMMLHIKQDISNRALRIEHDSATDFWDNGIGVTTKNYKFYYNNVFRADISSVDGSYTQSSDSRLKHNLEYMDSVLEKVNQLKPATYQYTDNDPQSAQRSTGFVAQDVEGVFPNLVRELDDGYKGVVYDGFAVISIKAIQELNTKMATMQREIDDLKKIVESR